MDASFSSVSLLPVERMAAMTWLRFLVFLELPGDFPLAGVRGPERRQRSF
jgi:hypothetical protein